MMAMMMWDLVPTSTRGRAITRSPCRPGEGARMSAAGEHATPRRQRDTTKTSRDSSIFRADRLDVVRMESVSEMANPTEIGRETRAFALCAAIPVGGMSPFSRGSITAPGAAQRAAKPWCRKDSRATGILVEEGASEVDRV